MYSTKVNHGTTPNQRTRTYGKRGTASPQLSNLVLGDVSPFEGGLELLLRLAVLGQIEGGHLLRLLHLPPHRLQLGLQLLAGPLQPHLSPPVLLRLEQQLLDAALVVAEGLQVLQVAARLAAEARLQLGHLGLERRDEALAVLGGGGLGLLQPRLQLANLRLQELGRSGQTVGVFLFLFRLVCFSN